MFEDVKYQVAIANRALHEVGLASGPMASKGHISMRVPEDPNRFVVKGRGYEEDALALMRPEDMVVCDLDGYKVEGPEGSTPPQEVKIHSCILRTYPNVQSVVHVHPRYVILMTLLRAKIRVVCHEGPQVVRRTPPLYEHYKIIQSDEEGMEVANLLGDNRAVLLLGHGAATVGNSLSETFMNMYNLEEQARMNYQLYCAAGPEYPTVPEELLAAPSVPMSELPHLAGYGERRPGAGPRVDGSYAYYSKLAAQKLSEGRL
jgi:ribulose-5-phosphate 4-epimerase/fuculose-1-phosphate aldolase